ncbi:MAG TPA: adenylate/guanylate cyclase domain-containing protein [Rhizomicrobium sp.]|nr:adenylate/guanylate cyclase domain-containing protein [Rhizomicrobium sp.]
MNWTVPLSILLVACLMILVDPGGFATHLRALEFDAYQQARPRPFEDTRAKVGHSVKILGVDDASIAKFGRWPWPRDVLGRLVSELKAAGATLVVLDLPLDEPDPAIRFAQSLPNTPELAALRGDFAKMASPDDTLATALAQIPAVTGFTLGENGRAPIAKADFAVAGSASPISALPKFSSASASLAHIEAASAGVGALNLPASADGEVHSAPMLFRLNGKIVPSLDAETLRLISGAADPTLFAAESGLSSFLSRTVVKTLTDGGFTVALSPSGGVEIYFARPTRARFVSAADLDSGRVAAGSLKGAIVYIAPPFAHVMTAAGPRTRAEVRAEAMENMLLGTELKPATTSQAEIAFIAIVGAGLVFLFARGNVIAASVVGLGAIIGLQVLGWFLFVNARMLLDAANPSLALGTAFIGGLAARHFEVSRARTLLKASFADSLPAKTIGAIARNPALLKLDGETRTVTCLSCHIRRFASIAEAFADDPSGFTRLINTAVAPLIDDAVRHGGMIARFEGEGFMACWNAPLEDSEHAIHACEAANHMTVTLAEVNEQLARERRLDGTAYQPLEIGIGISTGRAIAGGFAANGGTIYSVTGDSTVMADRIRALSAQYGPAVIVGEAARKAAQRGFAFLEVDFIAAGPHDEPIKLYAMLGNPLVRASPKFRALETFHEHIFQSVRLQQWEKARGLIDQCRKLSGASQKIYDLHLARIGYFETNPPGAEWDGAFRPILK